MMYNEFIELTNVEVSEELYSDVIEPMYMSSNLDKVKFCKMFNTDKLIEIDEEHFKKNIEELVKVYNFFEINYNIIADSCSGWNNLIKLNITNGEILRKASYKKEMSLVDLYNFILNDLNDLYKSKFGKNCVRSFGSGDIIAML